MSRDTLQKILGFARWAPSRDNTQPWHFEIAGDNLIRIHGHDTLDHVLYDFDGHPDHIAHGALLETLRIAASSLGLKTRWPVSSVGEHSEKSRPEPSDSSQWGTPASLQHYDNQR